jgi:hypothetical protein
MKPFLTLLFVAKCGEVACRHFYFSGGHRQHRCNEFVNCGYNIPVSNPVNVFLPVKKIPYAFSVFDG